MGVKSVLTSVGLDSFCQFPSPNAWPSSRRRHARGQIFEIQANSHDIRNLKLTFRILPVTLGLIFIISDLLYSIQGTTFRSRSAPRMNRIRLG